jgi:RNA-splicing ligase RtcB
MSLDEQPAVGVDIGCGMIACKRTLTAEDLPDNWGRCARRSSARRRMVARRARDEPRRSQAPLHAGRPPRGNRRRRMRKDKDVIDETPAAYKDIDAVMQAQRDLVDVVHMLKQVVCVKGWFAPCLWATCTWRSTSSPLTTVAPP